MTGGGIGEILPRRHGLDWVPRARSGAMPVAGGEPGAGGMPIVRTAAPRLVTDGRREAGGRLARRRSPVVADSASVGWRMGNVQAVSLHRAVALADYVRNPHIKRA